MIKRNLDETEVAIVAWSQRAQEKLYSPVSTLILMNAYKK